MTLIKTPLVAKKEYWNIMLHSIITFVGQSSMQVVDLLFCRSLGSSASATVGTASSLFAWFLIIGLGIIFSLEFFIPNAIGEKDEKKASSFFYCGIVVAIIVAIASGFALYGLSSVTYLFGFNAEIAHSVRTFGYINALSYLPVFLVPVLRIDLQTRDYPHDGTLAFLWGNILNVFLNWVLVFGHLGSPAYGVIGSALSNMISRYGILLYLIVRSYQVRRKLVIPIKFKEVLFREYTRKILVMGMPISLHMLFEMGAFVFVSMLAARLAPAQNAAHAIVISLASFSFMVPLGISSAASLTMSKAIGEKNPNEAVLLGNLSLKLGLFFAFFASLIFLITGRNLIEIYTIDPDTIRIGTSLLIVVAIFQFGDAIQVIMGGCMRGVGKTKILAQVNAIGHWVLGIPIGLFLGFYLKYEIVGLWIGLCVGLWSVALGLFYVWRKTARGLTDLGT